MTARPPVYLDHIATTPCAPEVVEAMRPYLSGGLFHNPQSLYPPAEEALDAVETARASVAALIGASPGGITFTSGATESNNWAVKGLLMPGAPVRGRRVVTSAVEHVSVIGPCRTLERAGFEMVVVGVDSDGVVDLDAARAAVNESTALVTMTLASNEIGTIEPIAEVGAICRERGAPLHVDATNAAGVIPVDAAGLGASLMTLSAHMFGGPKGAGALYSRRGLRWPALLEGGAQESGRRAGTENVPAIVGFGAAAGLARAHMHEQMEAARTLRDRMIDAFQAWDGVRVTGHPERRLPHHASCVVDHVEAESLLLTLAMNANIYAASGTACSGRSDTTSHVLEAIGLGTEMRSGSLVASVGAETTEAEVDYFLAELPRAIERLRALSPFA